MDDTRKKADQLTAQAVTLLGKHQKTYDAICDLLTENNVAPDEGRKLMCLLVGMSLGVQTGAPPQYDELAPFIDWIAGGVIMAIVAK